MAVELREKRIENRRDARDGPMRAGLAGDPASAISLEGPSSSRERSLAEGTE
jgi:hypothetical protein